MKPPSTHRSIRLSSVSGQLLKPAPRWTLALNALLALGLAAALVWADSAVLDEVTTGQGQVIPASRVQVVQNLEGGIVKAILAKEGEIVEKGQVLFQIDATGFGSSLEERLEKLAGMAAAIVRLQAEVSGTAPEFAAEMLRTRPQLVARERDLYAARRAELVAAIEALNQQAQQKQQEIAEIRSRISFREKDIALTKEAIKVIEPLVRDRLTSRMELIAQQSRLNQAEAELERARIELPKAEAALEEARRKMEEKRQNFRALALTQLNELQTGYAALSQSVKADQDRVERTDVRSPVKGVIKEIKVTTVGQVVRPGVDIAEIVPIEEALLIEADVRPSDIAFLRPGQGAVVKVTAYDFTLYGTLPGKVERISADTIKDEKGNPFYKIRVRTERGYLSLRDERLSIIPGMLVNIDILTGQKTVLQYFLKPIRRVADQALRER
jgi:adhesin transport system membrane fusion protein